MEYQGNFTNVTKSDETIRLSDDDVTTMLKAAGVEPTEPTLTGTPDVEKCLIDTNKPEGDYCAPDTLLADVGFDLAHLAYSSLARTPEGLPGRGFYLWDKDPDPGCCDSLVVNLADYRPYNSYNELFENSFNQPFVAALCEDIRYVAVFNVTLMRSCRPVFTQDGRDLEKSTKRNAHGYNMMVDARTMMCCVTDCLNEERISGIDFSKGYWMGRVNISGQSHCSTVSFQVGLDMPQCCPEGNYSNILKTPGKIDG